MNKKKKSILAAPVIGFVAFLSNAYAETPTVGNGDSATVSAANVVPDAPEGKCCDGEGNWVKSGSPSYSWSGDASGSGATANWDTALGDPGEKDTKTASVTVTQEYKCSISDDPSTPETTKQKSFSIEVWPKCGDEIYDSDTHCCVSIDVDEFTGEILVQKSGEPPCTPTQKSGGAGTIPVAGSASIAGNTTRTTHNYRGMNPQFMWDVMEVQWQTSNVHNIHMQTSSWKKEISLSGRTTGCGSGDKGVYSLESPQSHWDAAASIAGTIISTVNQGVGVALSVAGTVGSGLKPSSTVAVAPGIDGEPGVNWYWDTFHREQQLTFGTYSSTVQVREWTVTVNTITGQQTTSTPTSWRSETFSTPMSVTSATRLIQVDTEVCWVPCCEEES